MCMLHLVTAQYSNDHDMPCDPDLVSSAFIQLPLIFIYLSLVLLLVVTLHRPNPNVLIPTIIMYHWD